MRSQNEVIQVRCVEIKLKVNNNRNNINNNGWRERRSTGTKPQRKSWFILSSYWSPPKLLGCVSSHQWFPPFPPAIWICDHPGNAVTCSDAQKSLRFDHNTCGCASQTGLTLHFREVRKPEIPTSNSSKHTQWMQHVTFNILTTDHKGI